jgi:hypothetical protein
MGAGRFNKYIEFPHIYGSLILMHRKCLSKVVFPVASTHACGRPDTKPARPFSGDAGGRTFAKKQMTIHAA